MLETRRLELQAQLDAAYTDRNPAKIETLRRTINRETLECTAHTAERVKKVEKTVGETKDAVYEMVSDTENKTEALDLVNKLETSDLTNDAKREMFNAQMKDWAKDVGKSLTEKAIDILREEAVKVMKGQAKK